MPTKSPSRTNTRRQDWLGPAIHPGELLLEEYLKPLGVGQLEAAKQLGVSLNRLNEIAWQARHHRGHRGAARAVLEDLAPALDAAPGLLRPASGRCSVRAGRRPDPTLWLYLVCTSYSGFEWIWRFLAVPIGPKSLRAAGSSGTNPTLSAISLNASRLGRWRRVGVPVASPPSCGHCQVKCATGSGLLCITPDGLCSRTRAIIGDAKAG